MDSSRRSSSHTLVPIVSTTALMPPSEKPIAATPPTGPLPTCPNAAQAHHGAGIPSKPECRDTYPHPGAVEEGLTHRSGCDKIGPTWPPWKRRDGWTGWANENVGTMALVPSLVVQAFSTGILDATTYADFHTFASNQTGNTILLTVSALGHVQVLLLLTGVSLASFLLGALIFGHLGHFMGVRRRTWIIVSTLYQVVLLAISAILVSPAGPRVTQIGAKHEWITLALFATMSGAQVAMARQSGSQELPTAPMTSSFVDLMADKYLFVGLRHPKAGPRNRRLVYIIAMVAGGFLGAVVHRFAGSWVVVVVTLALKLVALALVCIAAADDS